MKRLGLITTMLVAIGIVSLLPFNVRCLVSPGAAWAKPFYEQQEKERDGDPESFDPNAPKVIRPTVVDSPTKPTKERSGWIHILVAKLARISALLTNGRGLP